MNLTISLPLNEEQTIAVTVAADRLGIEPWELAVHILALKQELERTQLGRSDA